MPQLSIVRKSALLIALPFVIQMSFGVALLVVAQSRRTIAIVVTSLALNLIVAGPMAIVMSAGIKRRLDVVTENARRFASDQPLLAPLSAGDEIAVVDHAFHGMAVSLAAVMKDLQHAGREMEAFSYSVSHDLRAPLRAIDGFSRILEEEYGRDARCRGEAHPRRHPRQHRQHGGPHRRPPRLLPALTPTGRTHRRRHDRAGAPGVCRGGTRRRQPEHRVRPSRLLPASGDLAMLRQVFANLLSNAVKFTGPRAAARIEVGCTEDGAGCIYYVKDNGVGFDDALRRQALRRLPAPPRRDEFDGTGVGLAIVQRIVQRHGGRVWAESVAGSGATFYFTLG